LLLLLCAGLWPAQAQLACLSLEPLPATLNQYLDFNSEVHLHGEFGVSFAAGSATINFDLQQESVFRMYVAPHVVDIDTYLYNRTCATTGCKSITSSVSYDYNKEEEMLTTLLPGSYTITLRFYGVWNALDGCPTLTTEIAIATKLKTIARGTAAVCPTTEYIPDINIDASSDFYYFSDQDTQTTYNVNNLTDTGVWKDSFRYIKAYTITVPSDGAARLLEVTLGRDFLTGNSLGLLLVTNSSQKPDVKCSKRAASCVVAIDKEQNQKVLSRVMSSGTYSLWLYNQYPLSNPTLTPCMPFSIEIKITKTGNDDNILSCPLYRLPASLNAPGLLNNNYLQFRRNVYLDLVVSPLRT